MLKILGNGCYILLLLGNKNLITTQTPCVAVVPPVGIFPWEIWNKQARVEDESYSVIKPLMLTESMMATFMSYHPHSCSDTALHHPVWCPHGPSQNTIKHKVACCVKECPDDGKIHCQIHWWFQCWPLEAVWWNSLLQLTNCEWRFCIWSPLHNALFIIIKVCFPTFAHFAASEFLQICNKGAL